MKESTKVDLTGHLFSTQRNGSEALSIDGQRQHMVRELCEEPHPTP